jgi:hypothetical protein
MIAKLVLSPRNQRLLEAMTTANGNLTFSLVAKHPNANGTRRPVCDSRCGVKGDTDMVLG